jgi:hypothetical protein
MPSLSLHLHLITFVLGMLISQLRSNLRFPESFYQVVSIYLLFGIGFKGGAAMRGIDPGFFVKAIFVLLLGLLVTVLTDAILKWLKVLDLPNRLALVAHLGSVSAITFLTGMEFWRSRVGTVPSEWAFFLLLLELPGIVYAVLLYQKAQTGHWNMKAVSDLIRGKSFVLLIAGFIASFLATKTREFDFALGFFTNPLSGVLCLFLLDLGIYSGERISDLRGVPKKILAVVWIASIVSGVLGLALAKSVGFSNGESFIVAVLLASSSYIAAPLVVRNEIQEANPAFGLSISLGLIFPWNLMFGIPLFYWLAN